MIKTFGILPITPIWTGNIDRDSKIPQLTGILGSLRWWYAGIIRGLGGKACVQGKTCLYDSKITEICPVCRLFGTTNYARRFRLSIDGLLPQPLGFYSSKEVYNSNAFWLWRTYGGEETGGRKQKNRDGISYQFGVNCLFDQQFTLKIIPLFDNGEEVVSMLTYLLSFLSRYAGIGAKIQNGYGLFNIKMDDEIRNSLNEGKKLIIDRAKSSKTLSLRQNRRNLHISHFFSYKIQIVNFHNFKSKLKPIGSPPRDNFIPCAFDLRYKYQFRQRPSGFRDFLKLKTNKKVANELLGNSRARTDDERSASKIFIGHPFQDENDQWMLRIYGYIPAYSEEKQDAIFEITKDKVHNWIEEFYTTNSGPFPGNKLESIFDFNKEFPNDQ